MAWVIKLWHHSNGKLCCIADNLLYVCFGVDLISFEGSMEGNIRIRFQKQGEAIIIHNVPMEHIEFGCCHCVQDLFNRLHREEPSRGVEHQTSIRISW